MSEERIVYPGRELEAMQLAVNYHRWIFQSMRPLLGESLVEVGAGRGSFSELLLEHQPRTLCLVEPSETMYAELCEQLKHARGTCEVETYNATFREVADEIRSTHSPDSILYINVLEHIADDEAELALMHGALARGGRIFIFVPALSWLYGSFDREVGHVRRYAKSELESKVTRAGFKILKSVYFDFAGVLPWFIKYRVLKSEAMEPLTVKLYDTYVVGITKAIESVVRPPLGKNIVLIAEKP